MRHALSLLTALCLAAPAAAEVAVRDDYGRRVRLAQPALRIVTLAPHLTEILYAAGAGERIVGTVDASDFPAAARAIARVGSEAGINLEALLALKPDLVAAWPAAGSARAVERIAELGIAVYRSEPRELEDIPRTIEALGELAGTSAAARAAAQAFRARAASLAQRYSGQAAVQVFYQVWDRPLVTVNGDHLISKVIALCGGVNVFASLPALAPPIQREAVLRADPEAIIASGSDARRPGWLEQWRAFPRLRAVSRDQLYAIPPDLLQRHSPRLLEGAERLCEALEQVRARR